jgi:hypothetical protein
MQSKTRKRLIAILCVAVAGWLFWGWFRPTCTYNYRLKVDVETPLGLRSGESVIQRTTWLERFVPGHGARLPVQVKGEAVYVDLGEGKNLFFTLTSQASGRESMNFTGALDAGTLPWKIFTFGFDFYDVKAQCAAAQALSEQVRDVPLVNLPTTVTFRDIADPKSIELVDPRDISKTFGPGYAMKSARIAITADQPMERIEKLLTWWHATDLRGRILKEGEAFAPYGSPRSIIKGGLKSNGGAM